MTIMRTVKRMDAGDVLLREEVEIGEDENFGQLFQRLSEVGARVLDKGAHAFGKRTRGICPAGRKQGYLLQKNNQKRLKK